MSNKPLALVFGGSRGIGAACVQALLRDGFDVAYTYVSKAPTAAQAPGARAYRAPTCATRPPWHRSSPTHAPTSAVRRQSWWPTPASTCRRGRSRSSATNLPTAGRGQHRRRVQRAARGGAPASSRRRRHRGADHLDGAPRGAGDGPLQRDQGRRGVHGALDVQGTGGAPGARQRRGARASGHRPLPRRQDRRSQGSLGSASVRSTASVGPRRLPTSWPSSCRARPRGSTARSFNPTVHWSDRPHYNPRRTACRSHPSAISLPHSPSC